MIYTSPQTPPAQSESKLLIVDRQNRGDYTRITDAIKAAAAGYLIIVRPGRYQENICIDRALTILGDDIDLEQVEIDGNVVCEGSEVVLQNLAIGQVLSLEPNTAALTVLQGKVSMHHCTVQGGRGMAVQVCNPQTHLIVNDCVIEKGKDGIHQTASTWVELNHCEIRKTEECGIFVGAKSTLMLHHSQVHSSLGNGILLDRCDRAVIEQCQIFDTGAAGIVVQSVVDFQIQQTRVYQHQQHGICLRDGSQGRIEDCEIFNNGLPNVAVMDRTNVEIRRTKIREGLGYGIHVAGASRVYFVEAVITDHNSYGIWLGEDAHADLQRCEIGRNGGAGLWLEPKSQVTVEYTRFQQNGAGMRMAAIEVQGKIVLRGCQIQRNYQGMRSRNGSSVIIKRSNVSGNVEGGLIQDNGGKIGRHLTYEGLVALLRLGHPRWKVVGAMAGVAIGLYGTNQMAGFVQRNVLETRSQIKALEAERETLKEEAIQKEEMIQEQVTAEGDQRNAIKSRDEEIATLKQDKIRLEAEKQSLQEQLEKAQKQSDSPLSIAPYAPPIAPIAIVDDGAGDVWGREAFRSAVMGKTQAQVRNTVGNPSSTSDGYQVKWEYSHKTKDPANGKTDFSVTLVFEKGVVADVSFYGG